MGQVNEPQPMTPKASLHPKNVTLYIWSKWKGVLYYELLPDKKKKKKKINYNMHCSQLDQMKAVLYKECPELVNKIKQSSIRIR